MKENQLILSISNVSRLMTAFYAEVMTHLITESLGTPLSAFKP